MKRRPGRPSKHGYTDLSQLFRLAEWGQQAACIEAEDKEAFFVEENHPEVAATFCHSCPVRMDCLEHALRVGEWGTWGGAWVPPLVTSKARNRLWKEALREREAA